MTFYCTTSACLRNYILQYFGEEVKGYCGSCENCRTEFDEKDMTLEAIKLIGLINNSGERFGLTIMLSALHGTANEKIYRYGLDNDMYFGAAKECTMFELRELANEMLLRGYIFQTKDKYPIVKVDQSGYDLFGLRNRIMEIEPIVVKYPKKTAKENAKNNAQDKAIAKAVGRDRRRTVRAKNTADENIRNPELFEALRGLRLEISKETKVPPYIIFTDVAIREMSNHMPLTKEEMLQVKGVGNSNMRNMANVL